MELQVIQLDQEKLSCSICLDLLKDPVTIPCGHSYCMGCIRNYWDENEMHNCPQCRQTFIPRPVLVKNTILAELVENLKKAALPAASLHHSYAGPGDVACDFCSGKKLKAFKSCLVCMASYCELHLQPHYNIAPLKKHNLIKATSKLQENICNLHDEVMRIFCRTDQQCICYLCLMDEHKGHVSVSAAAERAERQKELAGNQQKIQQRIQDREKDVKILLEEVETMNCSAEKALKESEEMFKDLIRLVQKKSSEVKKMIKSKQKSEESRVRELQEKIEQEIRELRRRDTELQQLSLTEDHLHFLNSYSSLSHLSESTNIPTTNNLTLQYFEDVTPAVSKLRDKLQAALSEEPSKTWLKITEVAPTEPLTRPEFLKYACRITLDPNTANPYLFLSMNNRKATLMQVAQLVSVHPERFLQWWQVMSSDALTGCCYWEVKWHGKVLIAVAYKDISRTGNRIKCGFGNNEKSWALECQTGFYIFRHNNLTTYISGPQSSRVGVHLDHKAGILSFYSVTQTMNLLHRVQTRFTQPLYAGFWLPVFVGDTVELCELK
ncbi:E3 ubiquitin/ISG15 ligase TRIM25-like [Archocentrus centrarchus]|uniref:E3 ubiquitin/ISG15 ligase TRIM25-like n=1 Tax=Archocentrus centrarchus TaxID=63155 RepID=UPI0011E9CEF0|nr:E3 ubiquitin/ISG15 ligase TRIM25-like [Archocentrus centrarchus]